MLETRTARRQVCLDISQDGVVIVCSLLLCDAKRMFEFMICMDFAMVAIFPDRCIEPLSSEPRHTGLYNLQANDECGHSTHHLQFCS